MTMSAGSVAVSVNPDGSFQTSGSGLALAVAQAALASPALATSLAPIKPAAGHEGESVFVGGSPAHPTRIEQYSDAARWYGRLVEAMSNGVAAGVVAHLQANAVAAVAANAVGSGLPAAPVALPIT